MKREEFIRKVNEGNFKSLSGVRYEFDVKLVEANQNVDSHRWYSMARDVYECEDGFVGVSGVFQSFSEAQTCDDIGVSCEAFPVKQVISFDYIEEK